MQAQAHVPVPCLMTLGHRSCLTPVLVGIMQNVHRSLTGLALQELIQDDPDVHVGQG